MELQIKLSTFPTNTGGGTSEKLTSRFQNESPTANSIGNFTYQGGQRGPNIKVQLDQSHKNTDQAESFNITHQNSSNGNHTTCLLNFNIVQQTHPLALSHDKPDSQSRYFQKVNQRIKKMRQKSTSKPTINPQTKQQLFEAYRGGAALSAKKLIDQYLIRSSYNSHNQQQQVPKQHQGSPPGTHKTSSDKKKGHQLNQVRVHDLLQEQRLGSAISGGGHRDLQIKTRKAKTTRKRKMLEEIYHESPRTFFFRLRQAQSNTKDRYRSDTLNPNQAPPSTLAGTSSFTLYPQSQINHNPQPYQIQPPYMQPHTTHQTEAYDNNLRTSQTFYSSNQLWGSSLMQQQQQQLQISEPQLMQNEEIYLNEETTEHIEDDEEENEIMHKMPEFHTQDGFNGVNVPQFQRQLTDFRSNRPIRTSHSPFRISKGRKAQTKRGDRGQSNGGLIYTKDEYGYNTHKVDLILATEPSLVNTTSASKNKADIQNYKFINQTDMFNNQTKISLPNKSQAQLNQSLQSIMRSSQRLQPKTSRKQPQRPFASGIYNDTPQRRRLPNQKQALTQNEKVLFNSSNEHFSLSKGLNSNQRVSDFLTASAAQPQQKLPSSKLSDKVKKSRIVVVDDEQQRKSSDRMIIENEALVSEKQRQKQLQLEESRRYSDRKGVSKYREDASALRAYEEGIIDQHFEQQDTKIYHQKSNMLHQDKAQQKLQHDKESEDRFQQSIQNIQAKLSSLHNNLHKYDQLVRDIKDHLPESINNTTIQEGEEDRSSRRDEASQLSIVRPNNYQFDRQEENSSTQTIIEM